MTEEKRDVKEKKEPVKEEKAKEEPQTRLHDLLQYWLQKSCCEG
jgi:hypothetical protein